MCTSMPSTRLSAVWIFAAQAVALACLISGCGGGEAPDRVSYDPPIIEQPDASINVPDGQVGAPPGDGATFTLAAPVKPMAVLVFAGRFKPKEPGKVMAVVVSFKGFLGDQSPRADFANALAMPTKEKDGYWSYRVQIEAPEEPRQYEVDIIHFGDLVAMGKVNVE